MPGGKAGCMGGDPGGACLALSAPFPAGFERFRVSDLVWVAVAASLVAYAVREPNVFAVCV